MHMAYIKDLKHPKFTQMMHVASIFGDVDVNYMYIVLIWAIGKINTKSSHYY